MRSSAARGPSGAGDLLLRWLISSLNEPRRPEGARPDGFNEARAPLPELSARSLAWPSCGRPIRAAIGRMYRVCAIWSAAACGAANQRRGDFRRAPVCRLWTKYLWRACGNKVPLRRNPAPAQAPLPRLLGSPNFYGLGIEINKS